MGNFKKILRLKEELTSAVIILENGNLYTETSIINY